MPIDLELPPGPLIIAPLNERVTIGKQNNFMYGSANARRRAKRGIAVELGELFSLGDLKHSLVMDREGITNEKKSQTQNSMISLDFAGITSIPAGHAARVLVGSP